MMCCNVARSGRLLPLQVLGYGAVCLSRPGSEHDERRLRFLHVGTTAQGRSWSTVDEGC